MNDLTTKKILITGATGFIGQHLMQALDGSNAEITILTRKKNPLLRAEIHPTIINGDVCDEEIISTACRGKDLIINLAGETKKNNLFEQTNINGTKNILKAVENNSVKKIIHLSSVGVVGMQYSSKKIIVDENYPCNPKNEYERTKLESEKLIKSAVESAKIKAVILRPTNVFGTFHPDDALLNLLVHCYQKKKIFFAADAMVNYLYVKDLVSAILYFIKTDEHELIYDVGDSAPMETFIGMIEKHLNIRIKKIELPSFIFGVKKIFPENVRNKINALSNRVEYSSKRLKTKFEYPYGLEKGLSETIEHYLKSGKLK